MSLRLVSQNAKMVTNSLHFFHIVSSNNIFNFSNNQLFLIINKGHTVEHKIDEANCSIIWDIP